jgi:hypothetical protein
MMSAGTTTFHVQKAHHITSQPHCDNLSPAARLPPLVAMMAKQKGPHLLL